MKPKPQREWTWLDYKMDKFLMNFRLYRELTDMWIEQNKEIDRLRTKERKNKNNEHISNNSKNN